jgi:hypothetical protein
MSFKFLIYGRLVGVRLPKRTEGDFLIAQVQILDRAGFRGILNLPYIEEMGELGSTFKISLEVKNIPDKEFLENFPAFSLSWVKEEQTGIV